MLARSALVFCLATFCVWAGEVADWQRHPFVSAPYLRTAPDIDGEVNGAEWLGAATLGQLKDRGDGIHDGLDRRMYVGYDDQQLYVAIQLERPVGDREPMMPETTGRVDTWGGGHNIQLCIDVDHDHNFWHNFVFYANGAFGDAYQNPGADRHWDAEWTVQAKLTETGWQAEVAIPFAAFGMDGPPEDGTVWGFDVAELRRKPAKAVLTWGFRGPSWHKIFNLGHLRFGGKVPAVRHVQVGRTGDKRIVVELEAVNLSGETAEIQPTLQLLRRQAGAAGGQRSFYSNIESGGDDAYENQETDFYKSTVTSDLIVDALTAYESLEAGDAATASLAHDQRRSYGFTLPDTPGEYLLLHDFRLADGTPLSQGVEVFRVTPPLALELTPFWLHSQVIEIVADLEKVEFTGEATVRFELVPIDQPDKILAQATAACNETNRRVEAALDVKGLIPGHYRVRATLTNAAGEEIVTNDQIIERPEDPVWHNNDWGNKTEVSYPWTPMQVADGDPVRVSMFGRTYSFSGPLPNQILSSERQVLAQPVQLELYSGGQRLAWEKQQVELVDATAGKVRLRGTMENDQLSLVADILVEFDGLAWFDLTLTPKQGELTLDFARLLIPMNPELTELTGYHRTLRDDPFDADWKQYVKKHGEPQAPWGKPSEQGIVSGMSAYWWMGTEDAGIGLALEAMENWTPADPEAVTVYEPSPDGQAPTTLSVAMIGRPATLTKPLELSFGLQASPIKPMFEDKVAHLWQSSGGATNPEPWQAMADAGGYAGQFFHWKGGKSNGLWAGFPTRPPKDREEVLKATADAAHQAGMLCGLYTGWGIDKAFDEYKYFGHEMMKYPVENSGFGTYRQAAGLQGAYADYMAWAWADLAEFLEVDGVHWDSAANLQQDANWRIGNGWKDDQGRVHPGFAVRGTRELFRRVYNVFYGEVRPKGTINVFAGDVWCINVYGTRFHRGEGQPMHAKKLIDAWNPLEVYRARFWARPFGMPYLAMNKNFKDLPMKVNHHLAVTLLHGDLTKVAGMPLAPDASERSRQRLRSYGDQGRPTVHIWEARQWLPQDLTTERHYYHHDQKLAVPEDERLLSSVFLNRADHKALVVVSNLHDTPIEAAKVTLDLAAMGFDPNRETQLEDVVTGEPESHQNGVLQLDIRAERYRLLKVWQ